MTAARLDDSFFSLTPERVLTAVEVGGRRATGYALALNSLENRVYEVELEDEGMDDAPFIEEQEEGDEDVSDIVGDREDEEET